MKENILPTAIIHVCTLRLFRGKWNKWEWSSKSDSRKTLTFFYLTVNVVMLIRHCVLTIRYNFDRFKFLSKLLQVQHFIFFCNLNIIFFKFSELVNSFLLTDLGKNAIDLELCIFRVLKTFILLRVSLGEKLIYMQKVSAVLSLSGLSRSANMGSELEIFND